MQQKDKKSSWTAGCISFCNVQENILMINFTKRHSQGKRLHQVLQLKPLKKYLRLTTDGIAATGLVYVSVVRLWVLLEGLAVERWDAVAPTVGNTRNCIPNEEQRELGLYFVLQCL